MFAGQPRLVQQTIPQQQGYQQVGVSLRNVARCISQPP